MAIKVSRTTMSKTSFEFTPPPMTELLDDPAIDVIYNPVRS
jgi:hypothetical protein